jgi:hypothetical protein
MNKAQAITLKEHELQDSDVLPLDLIESKIKYKLYQLDNTVDAYLILTATIKGGTKRNILRMNSLKNIHSNLDFVVNIVTETLTISNLDGITALKLTFGNLSSTSV